MNPVELLKKYSTSNEVFKIVYSHSKLVADISERIANKLTVPVDKDLLHKGAILHDIGRFSCPPNWRSEFHGIEGAKILRNEGFPELAGFCENHLGAGISKEEAIKLGLPPKDYFPRSNEEKIVCYADKLVDNDREIPIEVTIERYMSEFGITAVNRLKTLHEEITSLMKP